MQNSTDSATPLSTVNAKRDTTLIIQAMSRMRLMIGRRIVGRMALTKASVELELSHLDVIEAVKSIGKQGEVTVGAVAEKMRIDPSRGSRLVSELVQRGMLRRGVSQEDARRTVGEPTEKAKAYFKEIENVKRGLVETIVADWSTEDVERFGELYMRFVTGFEDIARTRED